MSSEYMERVMNASETTKFHFTENEPTPIVRDFKTFVNYIEDTPFAIGKKAGYIAYRHLVALNESMVNPNTENTPRTPQRFHPVFLSASPRFTRGRAFPGDFRTVSVQSDSSVSQTAPHNENVQSPSNGMMTSKLVSFVVCSAQRFISRHVSPWSRVGATNGPKQGPSAPPSGARRNAARRFRARFAAAAARQYERRDRPHPDVGEDRLAKPVDPYVVDIAQNIERNQVPLKRRGRRCMHGDQAALAERRFTNHQPIKRHVFEPQRECLRNP